VRLTELRTQVPEAPGRLGRNFVPILADKKGFDAAAEEEQDAGRHGADVLDEEQARTWINITVRGAFNGKIQGNNAQQRYDIQFHSNAQ